MGLELVNLTSIDTDPAALSLGCAAGATRFYNVPISMHSLFMHGYLTKLWKQDEMKQVKATDKHRQGTSDSKTQNSLGADCATA